MGNFNLPYDDDVIIDFKTHCTSLLEPEDLCLTVSNGVIQIFEDEDGFSDELVEVGTISAAVINFIEGENAGLSLDTIFDLKDGLGDYYGAFVDADTRDFKEELMDKYSFGSWSSLLVIDRVEIYPGYRGRGLGLLATEVACRHLGAGCDLAALKVFPLQLEAHHKYERNTEEERQRLAGFPDDEEKAIRRLKNYYLKMGFRELTPEILIREPSTYLQE